MAQSLTEKKLAATKIHATNIKDPVMLVIILFSILVFFLPRERLFIPFIVAASFIPADQRIILVGLDFTVLRILIIIGAMRVFFYKKRKPTKWCKFDFLIIAWAMYSAFIYIMQWGDMRAVIYRSGVLLDAIGLYWLFRYNIRSWDDVFLALKTFAICAVIMSFFVIQEWTTGYNLFSVLGRVSTQIRGGRFRCQASFPHPIIMGLYWAVLFPLFMGMTRIVKHNKTLYKLAAAACIISIAASNSSTPIVGLFVVCMLLFLYRWRYKVKFGLKLTFAMLIILHLIKRIKSGKPLWHLMLNLDFTGKSYAWHRYNLLDQFIKRFDEWWLLGTRSTAHWTPWGHLADVTNQYVGEGVNSGLLGLVLFLAVLMSAFWCLVRYFQNSSMASETRLFAWYMWISLIGHIAAFFAVSYFGQITMLWYLQLAIIGFIYEKQLLTKINSLDQAKIIAKNNNKKI